VSAAELDLPHHLGRELLSTMRSLMVLGQLMTQSAGEEQVLGLAVTAVPSLASCRVVSVEPATFAPRPSRLAAQLASVGAAGGSIELADEPWAWAYPLSSATGPLGYLVVAAAVEPSGEEQFLLRALAQQTGAALANRRLHDQENATAAELSKVNDRLRGTVDALQRSMEIHTRLTTVAVSGEGRDGIARAVHELTGLPVAIEDRYGNLRAWAGPHRPDPYPKDPPARREQLIRRAQRAVRPIRDGGRVVALAHPQGDVLGMILLVDQLGTAGK
jgi:hypothetical protein